MLLNILTRISSSVVSKLISSFSSLPLKCASFFSCLVYTLITYFFYYSGSHLNYLLDSQGISHKPGSLDLYWKHRILSPERVKSPLPTKMHIRSCCVVLLVAQLHLTDATVATLWTIIPPGSSVHGISQERILEWVAISFSRESSRKIFSPARKVYHDVNVLHSACSDLPLILLSLLNCIMFLDSNFLDNSTAFAKFPCWKCPLLPYPNDFFLFFFFYVDHF